MRFAISIPQFGADGAFDPDAFRAYLRRVEELGFDGAWTQAWAAEGELLKSERVRLGCAVFVTPTHSPVHLAKAISSLDQLSRGRVEVGLGVGGGHGFSAFGVTPESRVPRFTEGLDAPDLVQAQALLAELKG